MTIQFTPCKPCCSYQPTTNCIYTSPNVGLFHTFTISDPDWMYQPDLVVPSNFKLTHCETSYGALMLNPSPWELCDLTWNEDDEIFEGTINPSPTDDLGFQMTGVGTICRLSASTEYTGSPIYGVKIVIKNSLGASCGNILMLTRSPGFGNDKMWTGTQINNCYLCSRVAWKQARKDLGMHRFLWMIPECYSIDRSAWAGFEVYNGGFATVYMPSSTVITQQHWYNNMYPSWWDTNNPPVYRAYSAGYCLMFSSALQFYIQGNYYSSHRIYYVPHKLTDGSSRYLWNFEGDNNLEFLLESRAGVGVIPNSSAPPLQPWAFERWEY